MTSQHSPWLFPIRFSEFAFGCVLSSQVISEQNIFVDGDPDGSGGPGGGGWPNIKSINWLVDVKLSTGTLGTTSLIDPSFSIFTWINWIVFCSDIIIW